MGHEGEGDVGEGANTEVAAHTAGAVVREVDLGAGPEQVWEALTEPSEVEGWFGATVRWELEPGGSVAVDGADGARRGKVEEVVPGHRLRFRWWPSEDASNASAVTYELTATPGGTHLVVVEAPAASGAPGVRTTAIAGAAGAVLPPQTPSAPVTSAWDVRLVGLWLASTPGRFARV